LSLEIENRRENALKNKKELEYLLSKNNIPYLDEYRNSIEL